MDPLLVALALAGTAAGAVAAWLALGARAAAVRAALEARLEERDRVLAEAAAERARQEESLGEARRALGEESERRAGLEATLAQERKGVEEQRRLLDDARERLSDAFRALSAEALRDSSQSFLQLARASLEKYHEGARGDLDRRQQAIQELVAPVRDSLQKFDVKLGELEMGRVEAYATLTQQVRSLAETQRELKAEASNLVKALRAPQVRGRWGEVQLRRVVELAGMVNYCDFVEQETVAFEGGRLRPDLVVRLPGGKSVVVDAKAPLSAYLDAAEAPTEAARQALLVEHARQVREHVGALSRKSYWEQFREAPEFVVLFLPGEAFFSAALEQDPSLLEAGAARNVVIATPTTLIALLKAVAYGWKQEKVAENARAVSDLGRELHKRLADMGSHLSRLGRTLASSVEAYNSAVGTLESRVLVSARRLKELEAAGPDDVIDPLVPVEHAPRKLQSGELVALPSGEPGEEPPAGAPRAARGR